MQESFAAQSLTAGNQLHSPVTATDVAEHGAVLSSFRKFSGFGLSGLKPMSVALAAQLLKLVMLTQVHRPLQLRLQARRRIQTWQQGSRTSTVGLLAL